LQKIGDSFYSKKILQISLDFDNPFRIRSKKKIFLANLGNTAQNPKEKNRVKHPFRSLIWEHRVRSVPGLF